MKKYFFTFLFVGLSFSVANANEFQQSETNAKDNAKNIQEMIENKDVVDPREIVDSVNSNVLNTINMPDVVKFRQQKIQEEIDKESKRNDSNYNKAMQALKENQNFTNLSNNSMEDLVEKGKQGCTLANNCNDNNNNNNAVNNGNTVNNQPAMSPYDEDSPKGSVIYNNAYAE